MKAFFTIAAISVITVVIGMGCYSAQSATSQQYYHQSQPPQQQEYEQEVSADVFYNELSPFGRWVDYRSYGRVWISNERNFTPYQTGGHWVYTDFGWTWASDYAWGWAPFHYGRWIQDPFYGWAWIPGNEWAPAWVSWRSNDSYYGWAPLGPSININIGFGSIPNNQWCFVPNRYINSQNVRNYYINNNQNTFIINNTTIINNTNIYRNTKFISGPERLEAERFTGSRINAIRINNAARPTNSIDNSGYNIYRPNVRNNDNKPARVINDNIDDRRNAIDNNRSNRPETAQRPDGTTMTTLDNKRGNNGNNGDRSTISNNRDGRPSNIPPQTPPVRRDDKPIVVPPNQNTIPNKPINRSNWGNDRDGRPSNIPSQTPTVRRDDRPIVVPPNQNTIPDRPINRGNLGNNRGEQPSNTPPQTPRSNDNRGNFPQTRSENRPPNNPAPPTENRPVYQVPHKRLTEVSPQPGQIVPIIRSERRPN